MPTKENERKRELLFFPSVSRTSRTKGKCGKLDRGVRTVIFDKTKRVHGVELGSNDATVVAELLIVKRRRVQLTITKRINPMMSMSVCVEGNNRNQKIKRWRRIEREREKRNAKKRRRRRRRPTRGEEKKRVSSFSLTTNQLHDTTRRRRRRTNKQLLSPCLRLSIHPSSSYLDVC